MILSSNRKLLLFCIVLDFLGKHANQHPYYTPYLVCSTKITIFEQVPLKTFPQNTIHFLLIPGSDGAPSTGPQIFVN